MRVSNLIPLLILMVPACFSPGQNGSTTTTTPTEPTEGSEGPSTSGSTNDPSTTTVTTTVTTVASTDPTTTSTTAPVSTTDPTTDLTLGTSTSVGTTSTTTLTTGVVMGCGNAIVEPPELCDGQPGCGPTCIWDNLVFVTSEVYTGNIGGVLGADQRCQDLALQAGFVEEGVNRFYAWLAQDVNGIETSPVKRIPFFEGRYVMVTGEVIVTSYEGLYFNLIDPDAILHLLNRTETGEKYQGFIWTNVSELTGGVFNNNQHCQGWTSDDRNIFGQAGVSTFLDAFWTNAGSRPCYDPAALYCFEGGPFPK